MLRTCCAALAAVSILSLVGCGSSKPSVQHLDPATWCDHVAGGPSGSQDLAVDLSAAHAGVRFFGAELDGGSADLALANALDAPDALTDGGIAAALNAYKAPLMQVCVVPANDTPIGPVQVQMQGSVAVIRPGTGTVVIPSIAAAVAIDLRDLPNREDLEPVLKAAVAPALTTENALGEWTVATNVGLPPELNGYSDLFGAGQEVIYPTAIPATGSHAPPLALITGPRMAYVAAEFAADLRLSNKAWIVGDDVRVAVAESCWQGIGNTGVAYRCRQLSSGPTRWPDAIPADFAASQLDSTLQKLPSLGTPDAVSDSVGNDRPALWLLAGQRPETSTVRLGDVRAALITAHGAARLFYPYFSTVGDGIDARLLETLGSLGPTPDRATTLAALQRFSEVLADGQAFAADGQDTNTDKLPLILEQVNGEPVVRASGDANVHAGDRITVVDGVPFADWYAAQAPTISASTEAFRLQRAFDRLVQRRSATLTLVDVSGVARDVTVNAQADRVYQATRKGAMKDSGFVSGNNYYLNADGAKLDTVQTLATLLQAAQTANGLVLDLRGVPFVSPYDLAAGIVAHNFQTPLFHMPVWRGREKLDQLSLQSTHNPAQGGFQKKVVLLVGPSTVSYAEVVAATIQAGVSDNPSRVKIVGRNTAATGGNPSAIRLPGGFNFGFTGMEMLRPDGTTVFEGKGISPDVAAAPTQQDLANGVDTELDTGIATLGTM